MHVTPYILGMLPKMVIKWYYHFVTVTESWDCHSTVFFPGTGQISPACTGF